MHEYAYRVLYIDYKLRFQVAPWHRHAASLGYEYGPGLVKEHGGASALTLRATFRVYAHIVLYIDN
jgi:hypothetical protein